MIRRGVHKSVAAQQKDVRNWISIWMDILKPFVWRKTAEEILDSLAKYMAKISGPGHQRSERTSDRPHRSQSLMRRTAFVLAR
jgi:hypothetical protein